MDADERERKVRDRAHALWEAEGRPEGRHEHHWHEATHQLAGEDTNAEGPSPATTDEPIVAPPKRARQPRTVKAKKA